MGTTYPPDGYAMTTGTWGTDADMDTSVFLSGDASLKFLDTTPANNPEVHTTEVPCEPGQPLLCESWMRASSIAAGNIPYLYIYWLDSAKDYISSTAVNDAVLAAANTWYLKSAIGTAPANTCYALVAMIKRNTAFTANYDCVFLRTFPSACRAYREAALTVGGDAETKIPIDTEVFDYGGICDVAVNNRIDIARTGIYHVQGQVDILDVADTHYIIAEIYKNGSILALGNKIPNASGGADYLISVASSVVPLSAGDYLELYVYLSDPADRDISHTSYGTWLSCAQVY